MVRVDKDGDTVSLGNGTNVVSTRDGTKDRGFLVLVVNGLTGNIGSTTVGELDDDGRLVLLGSFKSSIDSTRNNKLVWNVPFCFRRLREGKRMFFFFFNLSTFVRHFHFFFLSQLSYLVEVQLMAGIAKLFFWATIETPVSYLSFSFFKVNSIHFTIVEKLLNVITSKNASRNNIKETHFYDCINWLKNNREKEKTKNRNQKYVPFIF